MTDVAERMRFGAFIAPFQPVHETPRLALRRWMQR